MTKKKKKNIRLETENLAQYSTLGQWRGQEFRMDRRRLTLPMS